MALSDKNIVITPNTGQSAEPKIVFSGASAALGPQNITLNVYSTDGGTLSWEGSAGQLFSITNSLTGTLYSVNDISGIPGIEYFDTGQLRLNQYNGRVLIGTGTDNGTDKVQVSGNLRATAFYGDGSTLTGVIAGRTAGSTSTGAVQYNGTTKAAGQFDGGTTAPTNTTRLNYDGYMYATRFYGDGSQLSGIATGINAQVISTSTAAVKNITYVLIASLTLTLPAAPTAGDMINVCNRSGTTSCIIARNGSNIMSLTEDLTIDVLNASFTLFYADATRGWTIL